MFDYIILNEIKDVKANEYKKKTKWSDLNNEKIIKTLNNKLQD